MSTASFPAKRAGLPSSAPEVAAKAKALWDKCPGRGPAKTPKRTEPVKIAGRRTWGKDLAVLVDALCNVPTGRSGLENILRDAPEILHMVNVRRAQAHNSRSGNVRAATKRTRKP
jgi:hypothetical protein